MLLRAIGKDYGLKEAKKETQQAASLSGKFLSALSLAGLFHLQIVLHREDPGDAIGADKSIVLVSLRPYHAFKVDMTVFHNDVNRRHGLDAVVEQTRIVENGKRDLATNTVVIERGRQDLNLVVHALHAFQVLYAGFC